MREGLLALQDFSDVPLDADDLTASGLVTQAELIDGLGKVSLYDLVNSGLVFLDEAQLVVSHRHDVAVLQGMLLDELAVHVRAVRAVQILEERVVEDVDDQRVMTRHRRVIDADVVVREAANRVPLLVHVVFGEDLVIQAQDQTCHRFRLPLTEPAKKFVHHSATRGERFDRLREHHRDVVTTTVLVG